MSNQRQNAIFIVHAVKLGVQLLLDYISCVRSSSALLLIHFNSLTCNISLHTNNRKRADQSSILLLHCRNSSGPICLANFFSMRHNICAYWVEVRHSNNFVSDCQRFVFVCRNIYLPGNDMFNMAHHTLIAY
uniref:Uncharacterized protein n=1 Tax=Glossina pallidipes TaxID=7398 RepID=A0A1A9ZIM9_GLOPL